MTDEPTSYATRVEQRLWTVVTGLAIFFGGWWLQNQYTMTLKIQEQLATYVQFADDRYVQKDYLRTVTDRLDRIESKIDNISNKNEKRLTPLYDDRQDRRIPR